MSMFPSYSSPARFRLRWRGYDRAEVDAFLRQTETDRQRLQEDLLQLEAMMGTRGEMGSRTEQQRHELERLAALRTQVASCLETSIGALHTATRLLGSVPAHEGPPQSGTSRAGRNPLPAFLRLLPAMPSRVVIGVGGAVALALVVVAYQYQPSANEMPAPAEEAAEAAASDIGGALEPAASPEPAAATPAPSVDGLVVALTAKRTCWIGTSIDGGQRLERMLKANETIIVRANDELLLRVGDAAALTLLINNQPARTLGGAGQVVTTRITGDNYRGLLAQH